MTELLFDGTFDSWRHQACHALSQGWHPSTIHWRAQQDAQQGLFNQIRMASHDDTRSHRVAFSLSRHTLTVLESAACYRDPERWNVLYRVIWRLMHGEPKLMEDVLDPDVRHVLHMDKRIHREVHKMHAFVRFRHVICEERTSRYVAWFEPAHDIVLRAAPFFVRRFPSMYWSILTPDVSIHWNQHILTQGVGMSRPPTPDDDIQELWTTYYANIFNPARVNHRAMCAEMPKRYWVNLPEARLIGSLVREASHRVAHFREAVQRKSR